MIDPNKKYRTRDGREVRIYATDGLGEWPVHGAFYADGEWRQSSWLPDGRYGSGKNTKHNDLIEVKPEVTVRAFLHNSRCIEHGYVSMGETVTGMEFIGAIDITHNGEKIIKVEIVNDYAPGSIR